MSAWSRSCSRTQSLALARDRLTADGVFVMYNLYRQPWLVDKLVGMTSDTFGTPPFRAPRTDRRKR